MRFGSVPVRFIGGSSDVSAEARLGPGSAGGKGRGSRNDDHHRSDQGAATGSRMRLEFGAEDEQPPGHVGLVRLLARAHSVRRRLFEERSTIGEVARAEDLIPSYVTRLVRLTFLAPDITASILSGRHDPDLTVSRLMADTRFPLDWKISVAPSHQPDSSFASDIRQASGRFSSCPVLLPY
jgi:hypothetical protein